MTTKSQAHFINNQLAVVLGNIELLERRTQDQHTRDHCARIRDAVFRISDTMGCSLAGSSEMLSGVAMSHPTCHRKTRKTNRRRVAETSRQESRSKTNAGTGLAS
jgi:hypothetical protein